MDDNQNQNPFPQPVQPTIPPTPPPAPQPAPQSATQPIPQPEPQFQAFGSATGDPTTPQPAPFVSAVPGEEQPKKKSKWRYVFIVLGILQILGVIGYFAAFFLAMNSIAGMFFILYIFAYYIPALGVLALVNLIGLALFLIIRKARGVGLILGILSLLVSLVIVAYAGYISYQTYVVAPQQMAEYTARSIERDKEYEIERANAISEISKDEAITLLNTCKLRGFYYTDQTKEGNGNNGELVASGVVLTKVDDEPYRISIADRHIEELVPIARAAQSTCGAPQFWHDGNYEQQQTDGTWR